MGPRYTVRLKPGRDDDLITWLDGLGEGERSCFIRQSLRQALNGKPESAKIIESRVPASSLPRMQPEKPWDTTISDISDTTGIEDKLNRLAEDF